MAKMTLFNIYWLYDEEITKDAFGKTIRAKQWGNVFILML